MQTISGEYTYTIQKYSTYSIQKLKSLEEVSMPNGKLTKDITIKGNLPEFKKLVYEITGDFEEYKNTGKYTFVISDYKEKLPSEGDGILAYLQTLKGVGMQTAEKMYATFGKSIFEIIEKQPDKLREIKGISKAKGEKIHADYLTRNSGHELFVFLMRFRISPQIAARVYENLGFNALEIIKENPYELLKVNGIGFKTADSIAHKLGIKTDFEPRIEAGIIEVLLQGERGGELFNKMFEMPQWTYQFFSPEINRLAGSKDTYTSGSTYLKRDICYMQTVKLLNIMLNENKFNEIAIRMHRERKIFITRDDEIAEPIFYRFNTAKAEFTAAKKIAYLLSTKKLLESCEDLEETVYETEKMLGIKLSDKQEKAAITAIKNPVSIITGGPGTGKTSVQKVIIEVFKSYFPEQSITLIAPTGRAAKRMNESTGYPASTIHRILRIFSEENLHDGYQEAILPKGLIIVDETSMIGSFLLSSLVNAVLDGSRVVFVGDIDQLPSIEVGAVLRELIHNSPVPVTKLTKTYRQANGSTIIKNAARIKIGENRLEYNATDFIYLADENSETIADSVCSIVPELIKEYGEDEVMVLTAYRKKTSSGANHLNDMLRNILRETDDKTPYFEKQGVKFYVGDKVMNTKNTELLTNGDIGKITKITKYEGGLMVTCNFDGEKIILEDDEVSSLELAYATTVHKSQGSEAKAVVLVTDLAHRLMLKRNLFYTGVTRAKSKIYIIGQPQALKLSIETQESAYRNSLLGSLVEKEMKNISKKPKEVEKKEKKNKASCEQLSFV